MLSSKHVLVQIAKRAFQGHQCPCLISGANLALAPSLVEFPCMVHAELYVHGTSRKLHANEADKNRSIHTHCTISSTRTHVLSHQTLVTKHKFKDKIVKSFMTKTTGY